MFFIHVDNKIETLNFRESGLSFQNKTYLFNCKTLHQDSFRLLVIHSLYPLSIRAFLNGCMFYVDDRISILTRLLLQSLSAHPTFLSVHQSLKVFLLSIDYWWIWIINTLYWYLGSKNGGKYKKISDISPNTGKKKYAVYVQIL